jgi:hypothetical protein
MGMPGLSRVYSGFHLYGCLAGWADCSNHRVDFHCDHCILYHPHHGKVFFGPMRMNSDITFGDVTVLIRLR